MTKLAGDLFLRGEGGGEEFVHYEFQTNVLYICIIT